MVEVRSKPIRVVVVEDTPAVRELLVTILQRAEGIEVVGMGADGVDAVRLARRLRPDVVTMDIVMPRMDGLEATRQIMREVPTPIVIVTAGLMRAEEDLTFLALSAGALTMIARPGAADPDTCERVVHTVRLMAEVPVVTHWGRDGRQPSRRALPALADDDAPSPRSSVQEAGLHLEPAGERAPVKMIGIAASTGGPRALATVLEPLPADFPIPILAVQHITQGFATGMAEWLNTVTPLEVGLAGHGELAQSGTVMLAPDDYHLQINGRGRVGLCKEPPYKGLRPSANFLFRSLAETYGSSAVGVVLTGMGDDGADGLLALHRTGALTLAQDEASCIVYGMPHEAVLRDAVDHVLSPAEIADVLGHLVPVEEERVSYG